MGNLRWRHRAACAGVDPELFFPLSDRGPGALQVASVKALCADCPVRAQCLAFAIDGCLEFGIYGGTTENDRRQLIRAHRAA